MKLLDVVFRRALIHLISVLSIKHKLKLICLYVKIASFLHSEYARLFSEHAIIRSVRTIVVVLVRIIYVFEYVDDVPSYYLDRFVLGAFSQSELAIGEDVLSNTPSPQTKTSEQFYPCFICPQLVFGNVPELECVSSSHDVENVFEGYHLNWLVSLHVLVEADAHEAHCA